MRTQPKLSVSIELFKDAGCDENDQQKNFVWFRYYYIY